MPVKFALHSFRRYTPMPPRLPARRRRRILALTLVYVVLFALSWPQVHATTSVATKLALALMPLVPMGMALWLIAMEVVYADELQQRVNLIALSIASAVVAALTFAAGVLCAAGLVALGGDDLMWVLPALALTYAFARWLVGRRYGGSGCA